MAKNKPANVRPMKNRTRHKRAVSRTLELFESVYDTPNKKKQLSLWLTNQKNVESVLENAIQKSHRKLQQSNYREEATGYEHQ